MRAIVAVHMGQRLGHAIEERLGADEAMVGQQIGAIGHVLAAAKADLEMQRAIVAEQRLRRHRAFRRHRDARQQGIDKRLLALAQGLALGAAIESVERGRIAGFVCRHGAQPMAGAGAPVNARCKNRTVSLDL
jgi:erythromycin esterase-like protein